MDHNATEDEILETNRAQQEEMEKHKWLESERAGCDIGKTAYLEWIRKYAEEWRLVHQERRSRNPEQRK